MVLNSLYKPFKDDLHAHYTLKILHHTGGYISDLFIIKTFQIPVLTDLAKLNGIFISFFGVS